MYLSGKKPGKQRLVVWSFRATTVIPVLHMTVIQIIIMLQDVFSMNLKMYIFSLQERCICSICSIRQEVEARLALLGD